MKNTDYIYKDSNSSQTKFKVSKTPKVDYLIKEKKFSEALDEINRLLKEDDDYTNWNLKGIILKNLKEYEKAVECFDKALSIEKSEEIIMNKSETLYDWAKVTYFPNGNYEKALKLLNQAFDVIPENEDASEYYFLKSEIHEALGQPIKARKYYLTAFKEFDKLKEFEEQVDYLQNTSDMLINITGCNFYNFTPEKGMVVELIAEEDNEHDPDAIAVVMEDKKIGYVANNPYTLIDEVKSASTIKNIIKEEQKSEIMFIYLDHYIIGRLI